MSAVTFDRYATQHTEPAPGAVELSHGRAANLEALRQRAFAAAGAIRPQPEGRPPPRPAPRRVTRGHAYLIHRLPNWRVTHWALRRVNRYLRRSGSQWFLIARYREARPGAVRHGVGRDLRPADARAVSIYLRTRTRWTTGG